jgi:hypothetical protein
MSYLLQALKNKNPRRKQQGIKRASDGFSQSCHPRMF